MTCPSEIVVMHMNGEDWDGSAGPTPGSPEEERARFWIDLDEIAADINASWPKGVSAEDAVNDVRREL